MGGRGAASFSARHRAAPGREAGRDAASRGWRDRTSRHALCARGQRSPTTNERVRLWVAALALPEAPLAYAARHGSPIRYAYVPKAWPLSYYQTIFAAEPGSAEMPSAGRAFTPAVVERLGHRGAHRATDPAHRRGQPGARRVALSRAVPRERRDGRRGESRALAGGRVVAVGTTVVRALESVASTTDGSARRRLDRSGDHAGARNPRGGCPAHRAARAERLAPVNAQAFAGRDHVTLAYQGAVEHGYLWHEFGDLHLITR